jgi:methylenetetrahydrofolate dehydrogenase (NADP+)/methenyltetrahydrofolate cyclohydrolase
MKLLYGKPIADNILERLKSEIAGSEKKPGLAVILAGNDEASRLYVSLKEKAAREIGIEFFKHDFPDDVSEAEILSLINKLNSDEKVHGIIVQLPLPKGINSNKIISKITPKMSSVLSAESSISNLFFQAQ